MAAHHGSRTFFTWYMEQCIHVLIELVCYFYCVSRLLCVTLTVCYCVFLFSECVTVCVLLHDSSLDRDIAVCHFFVCYYHYFVCVCYYHFFVVCVCVLLSLLCCVLLSLFCVCVCVTITTSFLDRDIARAGNQPFTCHSTQLLPVLVILFLVTLFLVILILVILPHHPHMYEDI